MTTQEKLEIVRALAKREDYYVIADPEESAQPHAFKLCSCKDNIRYPWRENEAKCWLLDAPSYLESLDALRPVLEVLNGKERWNLHQKLFCAWSHLPISVRPPNYTEWLLTIPEDQLAKAIAEVIE
jgi:hypothetical protein